MFERPLKLDSPWYEFLSAIDDQLIARNCRTRHSTGNTTCMSTMFGVVTLPINFDERLIEVPMELKNINILVPDIYDLILSKIRAQQSERLR